MWHAPVTSHAIEVVVYYEFAPTPCRAAHRVLASTADDSDPCTADACDEISGGTHDPIALCGPAEVPSSSRAGRMLLAFLLLCAGALQRRWPPRRID